MTIRTHLRRTGATLAVATMAAGVATLASGAAQAESTDLGCTAQQVDTTLVPGEPGAGSRYGYLEFTAKPGEACYLSGSVPVNLVGAHDVLLSNEAPSDAPHVYLRDGSSAHVNLRWTAIAANDQQQKPLAITVDTPGNPEAPAISVPWTLDSVDATPDSHTVHVGAATGGPAPTT
ncbi:DUF4232 domain-containing protein [Prauserella cavernicola]|uniref:DUF4232 domain-containing protein n=1 Tax=Prauserella cavernicola TaxID=2800127 RepID=A0A934V6E6_9PSEU|nr:DUF4232 domain-containing protein [Prauserella cavernicola]MBK1787452.1 DUF4232 domain-containing protein [Prauserella cavernicola]